MYDAQRMQVIDSLADLEKLGSGIILIHVAIAHKAIERSFFHVLHQDVDEGGIVENAISLDHVGMAYKHSYLQLADELIQNTSYCIFPYLLNCH